MPNLQLIVHCADCGVEVDMWELAGEDLATNVCEIAGDLNFDHICKEPEAQAEGLLQTLIVTFVLTWKVWSTALKLLWRKSNA